LAPFSAVVLNGAALAAALSWSVTAQPCLAQDPTDRQTALDILAAACLGHLPDFAGTAAALLATGDYDETGKGSALRHAESGLTVEIVSFFGGPACLVGTFARDEARSLAAALNDLPPAGGFRHLAQFIVDHASLQGAGVIVQSVPEGVIIE
jgi:hypothetical protein